MNKSRAIEGRLLALLKEYRLTLDVDGAESSFFPLERDSGFPSGIAISWWRTKKALRLLEDIGDMLVQYSVIGDTDPATAAAIVEHTLQQNAFNNRLFEGVMSRRSRTLFDARACEPLELSKRLYSLIQENCASAISEWLIVVPLQRCVSGSVTVFSSEVEVVASEDRATWSTIADDFRSAGLWNPSTGVTQPSDPRFFGRKVPESWIVCRTRGTAANAVARGRRSFKIALAVLFAALHSHQQDVLTHSMAGMTGSCIMFPGGRNAVGWQIRSIGNLMPPLLNDVTPDVRAWETVNNWFKGFRKADPELSRRAAIGAQFIHQAVVSSDIERFIHFFIALDAMFGERGAVEASILNAISSLPSARGDSRARIGQLYMLRNEILHGGASSLEDWPGFKKYLRRFQSRPMQDLATLAFMGLLEGSVRVHSRRSRSQMKHRLLRSVARSLKLCS